MAAATATTAAVSVACPTAGTAAGAAAMTVAAVAALPTVAPSLLLAAAGGASAWAVTVATETAAGPALKLRLEALEKDFVVLRADVRSGNELSRLAVNKMEALALASEAMIRMMREAKARDTAAAVVGPSGSGLERPGRSAAAEEENGANAESPVAAWGQKLSVRYEMVSLWVEHGATMLSVCRLCDDGTVSDTPCVGA